MHKTMILHITTEHDWKTALQAGEYTVDTLSKEGFIHCSKPDQVIRIANSIFKHQKGLKLLVIDARKIKSIIKHESGGDTELFPHIYGPINLDSIVNVFDFKENEDSFVLPEELQPHNSDHKGL